LLSQYLIRSAPNGLAHIERRPHRAARSPPCEKLILAFTALSKLPALAFFLLAERGIVGGLTGSVKG
jgi:ABC-type glycerol-3-phosphate transport system permease component